MRRPISTVSKILLVIVAIPFASLAALGSKMFGLKEKLSAREVAAYLRNFIEGYGGAWDWDDFTSTPMANPKLDNIRHRAAAVELPATEGGLATLRHLLAEAEQLAKLELES